MNHAPQGFRAAGSNVEIFQPVAILNPQNIEVGSYVRISEFALVSGGAGLYVGNFVHIANHASVIGGGVCIIEDFVGLCAGSRIISGTDDVCGTGIPTPLVPPQFRSFYRSFVICKQHSFIGTNAIIHPGVTIGEGAVVGSGCVVTKDLEPWGIYVGSPARRIRDRDAAGVLATAAQVYATTGIVPSDFSSIQAKTP